MAKLTYSSPSCFFFFLVTLFFLSIFQTRARKLDHHHHCPPTSCSADGPEIRFPFRLQYKSPPNCGYPHPAFQLSCDAQSQTLLSLSPFSPRLLVEDIDYEKAKVEGTITDDCVLAFFSNLSLSHESPFRFYQPYNKTIIDCSKELGPTDFSYSSPELMISCLGTFGHQVYLISGHYTSVEEMPLSCHSVKTIEIDSWSNTIRLRWEVPLCGHCQGGRCYTKNITTGEMGCHPGIKKKNIITVAGVASGLVGVVIAVFIAVKTYHCLKYSKLEKEYQLKVERFLEDYKSLKPTRYTFHEIKRMTASFKTKLGEGAYGSVFKGELPNGVLVAVKLLHGTYNNSSFADGDEFVNEVGTIGRIHHVNVVRLLGFCTENLKRALVYEFMPNESLEKFISAASNDNIQNMRAAAPVVLLGWEKLEEIAIGIARGIEYLHQGCDQRILHFDIKPQNILLDENFVPKVCDFGLAKLCSKGQSIVSVTAARGTMGYIAPEVFSRNFGINVSHKSDVYSFGMLLLEMVGGRKKMNETAANGGDVIMSCPVYFPEWIYKTYLEQAAGKEDHGSGGSTDDDQVITHIRSSDHAHDEGESSSSNISDKNKDIARKLSIVGLWCIQWYPVDRPSMHSVVQMLGGSGEDLTVPPNPFINSSASNPVQERVPPTKAHFSHLSVINE